MIPLRRAGEIVRSGGVVAYPTEGVYGLGCRPDDATAVLRIVDIKQRDLLAGLLLIAADIAQLEGWVDLPDNAPDLRSSPDMPITWIVPASASVPTWIRGRHSGVAVRISSHPVAAALCHAADMPLVSTSANLSGRPPARNAWLLRRQFRDMVDFVVPGRCGPARGPSEIRDLATGSVLRAAS
ncbi:MAG: L-threonylcarbamoyladenylate synthase [Woeseia sp.]|nr:L-threonylcarbamoyladenylate synthase [Woeseia sp.]MBT8097904.1 L-threonylcarbamoyladenylate synthase [Woeseia sp.]NNE60762.1 L-threonylcarbamoyladenylate synthase [Woeseia sp.]NNL55390.1 L-threonylcarbamoyladenylate synthase [Woeseia sp.]